ncbi:Glycosyltransferase [Priestia megaterium]|uniref:hypothetical protein n=1 Tax=Priestia megaterium TaxID=1404 RepID=UPI0015DC1113|nr:hypothetical protein [Priestia megaterium]MBD8114351.1 hypothetical protein [Priestia megaterium]QLK09008.1 hypothetical protein BMG_5756 [Priestia megaterium]UYP07523.1 hypothetical protein OIJ04_25925 [Priestia megaterium]
MFASTLIEELAKRQGHLVTVNTFNYGGTGVLAMVQADYITIVESAGYGIYENENIPVDSIQSVFFPA